MAARLHVRIPVLDAEGDKVVGATVKFYQPGTAAVDGVTTTGVPFSGNLYAAVTGGSPVSTSQTTDENGEVILYTDTASRFDAGIEIGGATPVARIAQYEAFTFDPSDLMVSSAGDQSELQTGTLAAPSLAQAGNLDTGFNVDSGGDPAVVKNGVGLLEAFSTSTVLRSPNGNFSATLSDTLGFVFPDQMQMFNAANNQFGSDYQIVEESSGTSAAKATNATALQNLHTAVATIGGGTIYIPRNTTGKHYALNAVALNHGLGYAPVVNYLGDGYATSIRFYGTSGPFFGLASAAGSQVTRGFIRGLTFYHGAEVTSGSTILLGAVTNYSLEHVNVLFSTSAASAFSALTLGTASLSATNTRVDKCTFLVSDTKANAPIVSLVGGGGLTITNSVLEGGDTGSAANAIGILCGSAASWDTLQILGSGIGRCKYGIYVPQTSISNVQMADSFIDGIGTTGILVQGTTGTSAFTWQLSNVWIASAASCVELAASTGAITNALLDNCYFTMAAGTTEIASNSMVTSGAVSKLMLRGCVIGANIDSALAVVDFQAGTDILATNNIITASGSANATIKVASGVDPFMIGGNILRGADISYAGALSNSRVLLDRAYKV